MTPEENKALSSTSQGKQSDKAKSTSSQTDNDAPQTGEASSRPSKGKLNLNSKVLQLIFSILGVAVVVLIVWGIGTLAINKLPSDLQSTQSPTQELASPQAFFTPVFETASLDTGIYRMPDIQITPSHIEARYEVTKYTIQEGDTIFGVADKFGLKPESVLWANRYTLGDTPDGLSPGFELFILPVDGVYHKWSEGEGLNGVASFYQVKPEDIINWSGNNLDPETIGDYAMPNIEPGSMLVVPGGTRPTVSWIVSRENPAVGASYLGPGACAGTLYGAVGTGTFTFPTDHHYLSGYDWNPPVHNGLDFDGDSGSPIYAADTGVVVYSGWSTRGYGNLIVVDHDKGWQTLYAHLLDGTLMPCGSNVVKGELIALMGTTGMSTGPHLHFEMRYDGSPVNPWNFLQ